MKKCFTSVLLFAAAFSTQLFAQTITATYTRKQLNDNIKAIYTGEIQDTLTYKQESTHPPTIYSYVYSNGKSLTTMTDDGGFSKSSDPSRNYTVIAPTVEIYFKDTPKNRFHQEWVMEDKPDILVSELTNYNWKVTKEKSTIAGYKCVKATGSLGQYKIEAWFANDIKISDGPTRFSGLPGLIVKVRVDDIYEIVASNIKITNQTVAVNDPGEKGSTQPFLEKH
nr:GLPGLI family protein [uncultured Flavobacterium sp.]